MNLVHSLRELSHFSQIRQVDELLCFLSAFPKQSIRGRLLTHPCLNFPPIKCDPSAWQWLFHSHTESKLTGSFVKPHKFYRKLHLSTPPKSKASIHWKSSESKQKAAVWDLSAETITAFLFTCPSHASPKKKKREHILYLQWATFNVVASGSTRDVCESNSCKPKQTASSLPCNTLASPRAERPPTLSL